MRGDHVVRTGIALGLLAAAGVVADDSVRLSGYLEYRKPGLLIVDGQRVEATSRTRVEGRGRARRIEKIPLGYQVEVKGKRRSDGTVVASEIEAQRNDDAFLEKDVLDATDKAEQEYVKARKVYQTGEGGKQVVVGALRDRGPHVDRARRIVARVVPPYVDPAKVRVYVVDNEEWNAMAMANFSIYVFSGLMADMDDDELAIVLGHEIAHATHEHSRRQAQKGLVGGLAGAAAAAGAEMIDSPVAKTAVLGGAALGTTTFGNAFSREYEDQADRVGLRYVYEAGYDHTKAPRLWRRFAEKYGEGNKVANFFFGDHSLATKRAASLEREIRNNYRDPAKDPPRAKSGRPAAPGPG